ncbi:hypothetical protein RDWZM_005909 [Blomia tropicalis]|uniref:non-specific serine/threonine protein kinase n=1 Tax=Blomia tropicalis TaxID=40697 RepID=A0A9Q0M9A4_BLOTA|nr:hypothetical protein RDWZM_005909 [Blomia tropicalis]
MSQLVNFDSRDDNQVSSKLCGDERIVVDDNEVYEKIKVLGEGSFSIVSLYRKVHRKNGQNKLVALKKLNLNSLTSTNRKDIEQAINEIKILSILSHENIIKYYGSFICDNRFYIETEYADAGTLSDFLASLSETLEELEILALFVQIVSAVLYLHQRNIIHRDIKTTNIFLTKEGFIKIGDFGISKILNSKLDARSFVGTPFYICPEIFEGKAYNKPCDIWAMGCVLYEMASLHRTFDANNLSSLMHKVLKGSYMPVNNKYSKQFHKLVNNLLQKNPIKRINSFQLLDKVSEMLNKLSALETVIWNGNSTKDVYTSISLREYIQKKSTGNPTRRSYLYHLDIFDSELKLVQIKFPYKIHLKQLAKGKDHFIALSMDNNIFVWGNGSNGQLGLGRMIQKVDTPRSIESLRNYSIHKVAAGHGFSVFVTKNGLVLTCGSAKSDCLGHHEKEDLFEPKLLNSLIKVNIFDVSCSANHVVVISSDGIAYAWGHNEYGKLGLGELKPMVIEPTQISVPSNVKFKKVFCGSDSTALLDYLDHVWMCGNNEFNKLALNKINLLSSHIISFSNVPLKVKLPGNAKSSHVALSRKHSLFFKMNNKVLAVGCNQEGQLGQQNVEEVTKVVWSIIPKHQRIKSIAAGSQFSLAATSKCVLFWGTRLIKSKQMECPESISNEYEEFIIGKCNQSLMELVQAYGPDYPIIKISEPKLIVSKIEELKMIHTNRSIILSAQSIIELYSPRTLQTDEMQFSEVYCFEDDIVFIVIESIMFNTPSEANHLITKNNDQFANLPLVSTNTTKHVI